MPPARQVWSQLIEPAKVRGFLELNTLDCIRTNLASSNNVARNEENWSLVFGYTLWNLWLHRNSITFTHSPRDYGNIVARTKALVAKIISVIPLTRVVLSSVGSTRNYEDKWIPPQQNWIKINTDGARKMANGFATCG
ncbi:hypothetical protein V6N13_018872 [Hibiscus sabdariffa]